MKALIIVDIQNDFTQGGALEVPDGAEIIPGVNALQSEYDLIVATQDWHPPAHKSFASNHTGQKAFDRILLDGLEQVLWPNHCIQGTPGAEFHPHLDLQRVEAIFRKGMNPDIDSYSGFYDNGHRKSTGLAGYLREREVTDVHVCGLAGDYCVYFTAKDSIREGFSTTVIENLTRSIDAARFTEAMQEIVALGGKLGNIKY
jgi:nicotinamidase/pyrazinamidase